MEDKKRVAKLSYLCNAEGSCLLTEERSVILVSLNTVEARNQSSRLRNQKMQSVTVLMKSFIPSGCSGGLNGSNSEKRLAKIVSSFIIPEASSSNLLQICIQELSSPAESNSVQLCLAINAICISLLDSAACIKCCFAGVTVFLDQDHTLRTEKQNVTDSEIMLVFSEEKSEVVYSQAVGSVALEDYEPVVKFGMAIAQDWFTFYREVLTKKYLRSKDVCLFRGLEKNHIGST